MRHLTVLTFAAVLAWLPIVAIAFTAAPPAALPSAADYSSTLLPEIKGVVSWKTLAQVAPVKRDGRMVLEFSSDILALDNKPVRVYGFMLPLDLTDKQKHFLISAVPASCPFCMPAGPEAMVEVLSRKPITYGFEPVIVSGKMSVLTNDKAGMLYRLTEAELVALPKQ